MNNMKNAIKTFTANVNDDFEYHDVRRMEQHREASNRWPLMAAVDRHMHTRHMAARTMNDEQIARPLPQRAMRERQAAASFDAERREVADGLELRAARA